MDDIGHTDSWPDWLLCRLMGLHDDTFVFNAGVWSESTGVVPYGAALWVCRRCGRHRWHTYLRLHRQQREGRELERKILTRLNQIKAQGRATRKLKEGEV